MSQNPTPPFPPERLRQLAALDYARLPSPCYVVHLGRLEENCCLLADVAKRAGCKILLAQKGFAMPAAYPLIAKYLPGTTSSRPARGAAGARVFPRRSPCLQRRLQGRRAGAPAWVRAHADFQFARAMAALPGKSPRGPAAHRGRPAREPGVFRGRNRFIQSLRALLAPRHAAFRT